MHVRSAGFGAPPDYELLQQKYVSSVAQLRTARTAKDKLEAATVLLNAIGQLAKYAPTSDLNTRWMARYRSLYQTLGSLRAQVTDNPPSSFMLALANFSDTMVKFGGEVIATVGKLGKDVAEAAGATAKALPILLLVALGVLGVTAFGYARHGGVTVRTRRS